MNRRSRIVSVGNDFRLRFTHAEALHATAPTRLNRVQEFSERIGKNSVPILSRVLIPEGSRRGGAAGPMHQFSSRCASSCGDRQSRMPKIMESKIRTVGKRSCSFPTALQRVSGQWLSVSTREKERVWVDLATRQSIGFATAAEPVDDALAFVGQVVRLFDGTRNGELPERCGRAAGWQGAAPREHSKRTGCSLRRWALSTARGRSRTG